jgi:prophage regulatory protein
LKLAAPAFPHWPLLLRRELAAGYLGMSTSTFDAEVKAGRIPPPISTTDTLKAWHRGDLDQWAEDRRAATVASANEWDSVA